MVYVVIIAIIVSIAYKFRYKIKKLISIMKTPQQTNTEKQEINTTPNYSNAYQRKLLFTKNEYFELKKLKAYADRNNLEIFAKVRLLDLVEPIRGTSNYQTLLHKIQAKHVDFVILDSTFHVKGIIEIDDNSHNTAERKERDNFVNLVLSQNGYKILRTRALTDQMLDHFLKM